jgi:hypothetical protein
MAHEEESKVASQGVVGQRQQRLLKIWLRYVESLRDIEEVVSCVNQKLGEISVMMRRRDHWKIS